MLPAQQGRPMQSVWIAFNAIIIARFPLLKKYEKASAYVILIL